MGPLKELDFVIESYVFVLQAYKIMLILLFSRPGDELLRKPGVLID